MTVPPIRRDANGLVVYRPDGATLRSFLTSSARVRIIRGPIRSGTSSACCQEIYRRACEQAPGPDGVRRTRWAIVRNTYPDLQRSTLKTWQAWFPERDFGRYIMSKPMIHILRKGDVYAEVEFLALDTPEDVSKLRSTEYTGMWFNEVEYTPKALFDEAESRVGYFPAVKDGGPTWSGVIADLNAPSMDHWLPLMTGEIPFPEEMGEEERASYRWPSTWEYFVQPPGLIEKFGPDGKTVVDYDINPDAENLQWIPKINGSPLYKETIKGKSKRWIDSRIMNRIVPPVLGTPVWPMFVVETHVARQALSFKPGWPLYVGLDFGRNPAAVFGQLVNDRWQILDELAASDVGASTFAPRVKRRLDQKFPGATVHLFGDPKGADKVQSDERTAYDIYASAGLTVKAAPVPTNSIKTRVEAVEFVLNGMRDGAPRFLVTPGCRLLIAAMSGGYHRSDTVGADGERDPKKDRYSDIADALQYMVLGAGEGRTMTGRGVTAPKAVVFAGRRGSGRRVA